MSVRRVGKRRRPGRPLLGTEPLSERLTVLVTASMMRKIEARSSGHVAEFVRRVLGSALSRGRVGLGHRRGGRGRRVRRFGQG